MEYRSLLQRYRYEYQPKLPTALRKDVSGIAVEFGKPTESIDNQAELKQMFPKTYGQPIATFTAGRNPDIGRKINVGVILSGGQAPGGHNVIAGLFDGMQSRQRGIEALRLSRRPSGNPRRQGNRADRRVHDGLPEHRRIRHHRLRPDQDRNRRAVRENPGDCEASEPRRMVVIGGDDSNTNAALLAEYFAEERHRHLR